ncbi:MAG: TIM barrel protein [Phycisphaerae bacterium]
MPSAFHICVATADPSASAGLLVDGARCAGFDEVRLSWQQAREPVAGVKVSGVDLPALTAQGREDFERQVDEIATRMKTASRGGIGVVSIEGGARNAAVLEFLTDGLRRLTGLADELGLVIHVRNRYGTRLEQPPDMHGVLADVGADDLMAELDVAEFHRASVNPCEPIWGLEKRIGCVRLSNVKARRLTAMAAGEIDMPTVVEALQTVNYGGPFVLFLGDDDGAVDRLIEDRRYLKKILGQ